MAFRFKKFEIIQEKSAMKVGTDGVLLGAWADYDNPKQILDIGTGTGLIALMLAQRFSNATITAIEIDKPAGDEAKNNFSNSEWNNRLKLINIDFLKWEEPDKFDLLVCNPPYFTNDLQSPDKQRAIARSGTASGTSILCKAIDFMHQNSQVCFIIPANQLDTYLQKAESIGLKKLKTLFIKPTLSKPANRVMVSFGFCIKTNNHLKEDYLIIEEGGRHQYSEEYKMLTRDFYIAM
jgi:tRNA1Val (adenine37-N6)-methyltransferase